MVETDDRSVATETKGDEARSESHDDRRSGDSRDRSQRSRQDYGRYRDDDRRRGGGEFRPIEVPVINGNLEGAIRALKRKMNREGILKQLKLKRFYEKPSVRRKRKRKEAERRRRRLLRRLARRATQRRR